MFARACIAAGMACACGAAAEAAISFTFQDPSTAREVTQTASGAATPGSISYNPVPAVSLRVDGTEEGLGVLNYSTTLTMNISVGPGGPVSGVPGALSALLSGNFSFFDRDSSATILTGTFTNAAIVTLTQAGAIISTSQDSLMTYTAAGALLTQLNNHGFSGLTGPSDAAFTLTDITPTALLNGFGFFNSFTANAAFTGTTHVVPAPGALGLTALAALGVARRRRR